MDQPKEGYWSKHHTGVIQCVLALYCAVLGTLEYIHTRSIPPASATPSPPTGAAMTHGYSMPLYLLVGIIGLCLSVAIPAVIGMLRKRQAPMARLTIISAHYGLEGGPDEDVAEKYLRPRICGGAFAGYVGADLFGALDPAIGKHKRLKVRYSFQGREETIERGENELLVLPEDPRLKQSAPPVDRLKWTMTEDQLTLV